MNYKNQDDYQNKGRSVPHSSSSLAAWISYIEKLYEKDIDMSLERVKKVALNLNVLKLSSFIFIIAGTNGKGSTCCILEAILIEAGYKVGVYSSPHLLCYTERVRIQGNKVSEFLHVASFSKIESVRDNILLTFFEYSTLSALCLFKQAQLDVLILEVGLGGRLDATNIIDADIAIITNVSLDHTNWLGDSFESIGREKAGIFRTGKPAIIGESNKIQSIFQIAKEKKTVLLYNGINWHYSISENAWCYSDEKGGLINLPLPHVPQPNAATALAAIRASTLIVKEQAIRKGIQNAILPGRFQIISKSPRIILDVAHNPHAALYLKKRLKSILKIGHVLAIVGMLKDKDIQGTLTCMKSIVDKWYFASLEGPRGASANQLIKYIKRGKTYDSVVQALKNAIIDAHPEDTLLVFGSFHTIAHILKALKYERLDIKNIVNLSSKESVTL